MALLEVLGYILALPLKALCTLTLWIMGWRLSIPPFPPGNRAIAVFSHTSRWDFIMYLLYRHSLVWPWSCPPMYVLVMPQVFEYLGGYLAPLLSYLGAIPGSRLEERGKGVTERVVSILNSQPRAALLISPKGCTIKAPWRSGYYHLAVASKADLAVVGMDYHIKSLVYSDLLLTSFGEGQSRLKPGERGVANIPLLTSKEEIEAELKRHLQTIIPLNPEGEVVEFKVRQRQSLMDDMWPWRLIPIEILVLLFIML